MSDFEDLEDWRVQAQADRLDEERRAAAADARAAAAAAAPVDDIDDDEFDFMSEPDAEVTNAARDVAAKANVIAMMSGVGGARDNFADLPITEMQPRTQDETDIFAEKVAELINGVYTTDAAYVLLLKSVLTLSAARLSSPYMRDLAEQLRKAAINKRAEEQNKARGKAAPKAEVKGPAARASRKAKDVDLGIPMEYSSDDDDVIRGRGSDDEL